MPKVEPSDICNKLIEWTCPYCRCPTKGLFSDRDFVKFMSSGTLSHRCSQCEGKYALDSNELRKRATIIG